MGEVFVDVEISALDGAKRKKTQVKLLVDTGAVLSVVPAGVLRKLGIRPDERRPIFLADGRRVERPIGHAWFTLQGKSAPAAVVFGNPRDSAVLGVTVLEQLSLGVDPERGRVIPTRLSWV